MSRKLEGKTALVTGGSRGIGAAIAEKLRADGWTVATLSRNGSVSDVKADLLVVAEVLELSIETIACRSCLIAKR